jgi:hypothetical protein
MASVIITVKEQQQTSPNVIVIFIFKRKKDQRKHNPLGNLLGDSLDKQIK